MIGEAIRPELASALTRGAGIKSLAGIDVANQIVPVMVVENISAGPFPPCRIWHAGILVGASVGNFSHAVITNLDPAGRGSSVTVDYILVRPAPAQDMAIVVGQNLTSFMTQTALVEDCSNEAGGLPLGSAFDPQLGNVQVGAYVGASALNGALCPHNSLEVKRIDGPWTLGPQAALMVRCTANNSGLAAYFKGRYHAGV